MKPGDVTFERMDSGREIARRDGKIIAEISPDGEGYGGWVHWLDGDPRQRMVGQALHYVRSRPEGRALITDGQT